MKRIYALLLAMSSLALGFTLSSFFYSRSSAPQPYMSTYNFSPISGMLRIVKGTKSADNSYYLNIINYSTDSVTVNQLDSFNLRNGCSITYDGGTYLFQASHYGIDSIPRSTFSVTTYTLVDSTIYSRYGVIYGKDNTGKAWTFNMSDIVTTQGGAGTVTFGIVPIDIYE
jgi:hypothetical protein